MKANSIMTIILVLGGIGAVVAIVYRYTKWKNLTESGQIIKRAGAYYEKAQIYITSRILEFSELSSRVNAISIPNVVCDGINEEHKAFHFSSRYGWQAQMVCSGGQGDSERYVFEFTNWEERNYAPLGLDEMNMILTALEKAFLSLDESTRVDTEERKFKSKMKFF